MGIKYSRIRIRMFRIKYNVNCWDVLTILHAPIMIVYAAKHHIWYRQKNKSINIWAGLIA
jgi:hypothetical protein